MCSVPSALVKRAQISGGARRYSTLLKVYKGLKQVDSNVLQVGRLEGMSMNEIEPFRARCITGI